MRDPSRSSERGAVAPLVVLLIVVLGGLMALALNVGHLMSARGEVQNAADAGALAGAGVLAGSVSGCTAAVTTGVTYGNYNQSDGVAPGVGAADVELGRWTGATRTFAPAACTTSSAPGINAIRVSAGRQQSRGNAVPVAFNGLIGAAAQADVVARPAVAVRASPRQGECILPFAVPGCLVAPGGIPACGQSMTFSAKNDNSDTMGLTGLGDSANTNSIRAALNAALSRTSCQQVERGQSIRLENGTNLNPLDSLLTALEGGTYRIPIVDPACPNPRFNRTANVIGFATVVFEDSNTQGSNKWVRLRILCGQSDAHPSDPNATQNYGTWGQPVLAE